MRPPLCKGLDISHHQGSIDFATVKQEGFSFVIIKAGGADNGYYKDRYFDAYYEQAKKAGLGVGCYYYNGSNFCSKQQGKTEAEKFYNIIKGKQFDYPVYADVEEVAVNKGKSSITDATIAFCETMEAYGYYCGIYASDISGFNNRLQIERIQKFDKWVARYNNFGPSYVTSYGMWQYGGSVNYIRSPKVKGVSSSACDQDYCYVDYPSIIKSKCLNGYKKLRNITVFNASNGDINTIRNKATELGLKYSIE